MLTALIIVTSITQVILALFVFLRSRHNLSNRLFFLIAIASLGWALSNYLTIDYLHSEGLITLVRFILFFVVIQNTFFYMFGRTFPDRRWRHSRRWLSAYLGFSAIAAAATLSPYTFTAVTIEDGLAVTTAGPAIMLFMIHAAVSIVSAFRALIKKAKHTAGAERAQVQILLFASFLIWVIVPVTNFALTPLLKTTFFIQYSPLYTFAFAALIAYAIVAQKLFDIRAAAARSVGYLMIVVSMTLVYGIGLFGVIDVLFPRPDQEFTRQVLSVVLITPLALLFERTRKFFDRVTSRLFFRDSYDTQEVLDAMGEIVVSEIDLYQQLRNTRRVLSGALKPSSIDFILIKGGRPFIEAATTKTIPKQLLALSGRIESQHQELVVVDALSPHNPLYQYFKDAGVAVSLQLKIKQQVVGYIVFGAKRSGDIYSVQDTRLLRLVASELAITIQNALRFEEIQNFNLTLQASVNEATRKLRRTNDKLKALDEAKDDFVSMASHQLRTPLTSVKGYISMVLEGDAGKINATERKLLEQAFISSQRMVYLIADLLNVSRLKTGKFVIEQSPVNLAELVQQEIEQLTDTAAGRSLKLSYEKPAHFPELMLDETKTRQVIMNFVDNAIYYTPAGGSITVSLVETAGSVELRVRDTGIGVPKSERPHLFTKFYRAANARTARPDGTGLGLFMAKKVIVAQGGAIIFETEDGKGSTFGFVFPKFSLAVDPKKKA
ncbi:MAG TPA: ATP-binding protein [Candidatus Saccharimonadales bacterium]